MEAPLCKGPLREQCVCNAIIVSRNDNFCCLEPSAQLRCNRLWFYGRFPACFSFLLALFIFFISIILCFSVWRRIIVILLPPSVTWICWMWWDWERIIIMAFMPVSKCSSMLNYCGDLFHGSVEISSFDGFIRSALLVLTHIVSRRRRKLWAHRRRHFDPPPPPHLVLIRAPVGAESRRWIGSVRRQFPIAFGMKWNDFIESIPHCYSIIFKWE